MRRPCPGRGGTAEEERKDDVIQDEAPLRCRECDVLIGAGYANQRALPTEDGQGVLCYACYLWRQRRPAARRTPATASTRGGRWGDWVYRPR